MQRYESALFWLLLLAVLLSPLPLGSNRPLPASVLFAAVGLIVLAWGLGVLIAAVRPTVPARAVWPALVLFGAAAAWAAIQASPLTPESWHHPFWAEARAVLDLPVQGAVSASPGQTWTRLTGLLAYAGIFWVALQLCRSPERAGRVLLWCAAAGSLYALYGLYNYFSGAEKILWLDKWTGRGAVTGTFVNRNSYATFAGMTLFCCLGLCVREVLREGRRQATLGRVVVEGSVRGCAQSWSNRHHPVPAPPPSRVGGASALPSSAEPAGGGRLSPPGPRRRTAAAAAAPPHPAPGPAPSG